MASIKEIKKKLREGKTVFNGKQIKYLMQNSNFDAWTGHSEIVKLSEHPILYTGGNGMTWARSDSPFGQTFNINFTRKGGSKKGKIITIELGGYRKNRFDTKINADIKKKIKKQKCRVLNVGGRLIECDHKDGRKDDYGLKDEQEEEDFQPLHHNVNTAKRTHCGRCKKTNKRFDARKLGYPKPVWIGEEEYCGECQGCYLFDPKKFNEEICKA